MVHHVSIAEATQRLQELLAAAAAGDTIVIDDSPELQFQIVPIRQPTRRLTFGSARGKIHMTDDFDAPLEEFEEYM